MPAIVFDPDPVTRECVALVLRAQRLRTVACKTVRDARAALAADNFELIVLDPAAEPPASLELLAQIRADPRLGRVPVVALTTSVDKAQILRIIELGVAQCMLKRDFTVNGFVQNIARARNRRTSPLTAQHDAPQPYHATPQHPNAIPSSRPHALPQTAAHIAPPAPVTLNIPNPEDAIQRLAALKPIVSRAELSERLHAVAELRALSPTVTNVMRMVSRPDTSIDAIVRAVRADHAIALKIVKIANSSAYIRGEPVCSVKDAVVRIGTESIRQAVTNIGIIEQFSSESVLPGLRIADFWEHAIGVAILTAELARITRTLNPDEAFTVGLLHDIGRVLLAEAAPNEYRAVIDTATQLALPLEYVEKRMLLSTHADIAQDIFSYWGIPQDLIDPIVNHHQTMANLRRSHPKSADAIALLALANRMAHALELGSSGNNALYPTDDFFVSLQITPQARTDLALRVPDMVQDLRFAMLSERVGQSTDRRWSPPPAVYLSEEPADTLALYFKPREPSENDPPRIAVLRIRSAAERIPVTNALLQTERALGRTLPLVVLSPKGNINILENHLQGRSYACLHLPLTIPRLRAAIDRLTPGLNAAVAA